MPNPTKPGAVPRLTPHSFFSCNTKQTNLFSVNGGIPLLDALQEASCFLASARGAAYHANEGGADLVYSAAYLIEMAKAIIDSAVEGLEKGAIMSKDATTKSQATAPATDLAADIDTVRRLFGELPEDVLIPAKIGMEALLWLEEICATIAKEALDERNGHRIKHLAELGAFLAQDRGNLVDCNVEDMFNKLRQAGVVVTGEAS